MRTCPFCDEPVSGAADRCPSCRADLGEAQAEAAYRSPPRRSGSGGCMIALAIGAGLAVVFFAWFLPAVQQAREGARRSQCRSNLKWIGLALHIYHQNYGTFPPAYIADENGRPMHSWRVLILEFNFDSQELYRAYDFSQPWDSPANRFVLENMPGFFACPSHPERDSIYTHYAAVTGPGTVFDGTEAVSEREITDGTSFTLLIGEVRDRKIPWTSPQDVDVTAAPRIGDILGFSSHHEGGAHFVLADGAVRFLSENIRQETLRALSTRAGGEEIRKDDF